LQNLSGGELSELPQQALALYTELSRAFGRFVGTDVRWGARKSRMPLYKLIFSNFGRLELVAQAVRSDRYLKRATERLEERSREVIAALTEPERKEKPRRRGLRSMVAAAAGRDKKQARS
jgi:hypothetical protein